MLSAMDPSHFPKAGPPEVAFLGRSNVGKSSLINSLLGEKLAKTSSTPGRTRSINFFSVRRAGRSQQEILFADLPGYGYAKISKEISVEWLKFNNRPFVVVGTKVDRVSNNALNNSMRTLKGSFGIEEILPYSTKTGTGRNELWRKIGSACGMSE